MVIGVSDEIRLTDEQLRVLSSFGCDQSGVTAFLKMPLEVQVGYVKTLTSEMAWSLLDDIIELSEEVDGKLIDALALTALFRQCDPDQVRDGEQDADDVFAVEKEALETIRLERVANAGSEREARRRHREQMERDALEVQQTVELIKKAEGTPT